MFDFKEIPVLKGGDGAEEELNTAPATFCNGNNKIEDKVFKTFDGNIFISNIPEEMKNRNQWINWCFEYLDPDVEENRNKKPRKIPIEADVTDPSTWLSFEEALKKIKNNPTIKLGFVFSSDDPYTGVDLDKCRDSTTGVIEPWAVEIIETLDSYTEISPSGCGVHIIPKAKLPERGRKKGNIEMYDSKRFFTFTGNVLDEYNSIKDRQSEVSELHLKVFGSRNSTVGDNTAISPILEDEKLIEIAGIAKDGDKFKSLFEGDISGYSSHSEADQGLCNILAFWTQDKAQIDRIFRKSGLIRSKWDEIHGWGTYGEITIKKALDDVKEHYQGSISVYGLSIADLTKDKNTKGDLQFSPTKAAKSILDKVPLKLSSWEAVEEKPSLWTCEAGLWTKGGDFLIEQICDKVAGDLSRQGNISEVKRRIKNDLRKEPAEFDTAKPTLVGTKNGYVCDLMTGEVRQMGSEDYISEELVLPVNYNPSAKCPEIFKFYDDICSDDCSKMAMIADDVATLDLRAWAYIDMLLGLGGNGKGQRQKFRRKFFGSHTIADISLKDLNDKGFVLSELYRKRVLHCGEAKRNEKNGEKYSTSILKTLTGDDQVTVDQKYKNCISFVPFCKVNIDANDPPRFDDESRGFTRRFRRINTPYFFTENPDPLDPTQKQIDEAVIDRITTEEELSGYLNVLLSISKEIVPKKSYPACEHLTQGYEKQVYSIEEFKNQFCTTFEVKDSEYTVVEDLYEAFKKWTTLANASVVKSGSFGKTFSNLIGCISNTKRIDSSVKRVYFGVRFDEEKYKNSIAEMTERLKNGSNGGSNQCKQLSETYQNLKSQYGEDSW